MEKLSCLPKEVQESLKSKQQQLQEVEQRRHDLMPENLKVQKNHKRYKSIQDKRRHMQKESAAAQEEMRKIREELDRNEERFRQLSAKADKNKMVDADMASEPQGKRQQCFGGLVHGDDGGTVLRNGCMSGEV